MKQFNYSPLVSVIMPVYIPIVAQFAKIVEQMERTNGYTDRIFKCEKYNAGEFLEEAIEVIL